MSTLPPELAAMTREQRIGLMAEYLDACSGTKPAEQTPLAAFMTQIADVAVHGAKIEGIHEVEITMKGGKTRIVLELER
jgi:hypothetical protein